MRSLASAPWRPLSAVAVGAALGILPWVWQMRKAALITRDVRASSLHIQKDRAARLAANENVALGDIRAVIGAQAAFRGVNNGMFTYQLKCLSHPQECISFYPPNAPQFLDESLTRLANRSGYRHAFTFGEPATHIPGDAAPSSVHYFRYDAWPLMPGYSGLRAFAGDSTGRICVSADGSRLSQAVPGKLDPNCARLEDVELPQPTTVGEGPVLPDVLRVAAARLEPATYRSDDGREHSFYHLLVTLENQHDQPVVLIGERRAILKGVAKVVHGGNVMGRSGPTILPGGSETIGRNEGIPTSVEQGLHFLVLALRYGDANDYRTNRRQVFVLKWSGSDGDSGPAEVVLAAEKEAEPVRKAALRLGGWWGDTGPEQGLVQGPNGESSRSMN